MIEDKTPRFGAFTALIPYFKGNETKKEVEKMIDEYLKNGLIKVKIR